MATLKNMMDAMIATSSVIDTVSSVIMANAHVAKMDLYWIKSSNVNLFAEMVSELS